MKWRRCKGPPRHSGSVRLQVDQAGLIERCRVSAPWTLPRPSHLRRGTSLTSWLEHGQLVAPPAERSASRLSLCAGSLVIPCVICVTAWLAVPAAGEFYPARPVYDYGTYKPSDATCSDPADPAFDSRHCGPVDQPVFDSFVNTPFYGDERPFFDGHLVGGPSRAEDPIPVVTSGKREVVLRIYVDNDANEYYGRNDTAENTYVSVKLPTATSKSLRCRAEISASNAATVEDTVDLISSRPFRIQYIPHSAIQVNANTGVPMGRLSDSVVSSGTLITNREIQGLFAPGFDRAMFVEVKVRIIPVRSGRWWIAVFGAITVLLGIAIWPTSRRRLKTAAASVWEWNRDRRIYEAILANILAAGILVVLGWLIARLI